MRAHTSAGTADQSCAKPAPGFGVDAVDPRAGEQRGAFVDLVERIGHDDGGAGAGAVEHGLREREQRLAAAEHGQHLRRRIERRQRVAPREPPGDRVAQRGGADRRGIIRERARARVQRVDHERAASDAWVRRSTG